jgi:hypothetical protein
MKCREDIKSTGTVKYYAKINILGYTVTKSFELTLLSQMKIVTFNSNKFTINIFGAVCLVKLILVSGIPDTFCLSQRRGSERAL